MIVLIGGGSRSGKSRFALQYALKCPGPRSFIATAEALDEEMRARAAAHRTERGDDFETIEAPLEVAGCLNSSGTVVIDCLTLWTSNVLLSDLDMEAESMRLLTAAQQCSGNVVMVTNEVGCGIVPENELARRFRDAAGRLNQQVAEAAAEVYWMVFGCPLRVK